MTTKYDAQLSLGRVQTPTIQLVQSRQNEINEFKPQTYYTLTIKVDGFEFNFDSGQRRVTDQQELKSIVDDIKNKKGQIENVVSKHKKTYPRSLYNLTDLQQDAYHRYKMGPKETLNTLQNLYERHKLVTYPRTDSNYLTTDMVSTIKERLQALLATEYKENIRALMSQSYSTKMNIFNNQKFLITMQSFQPK